MCTVPSFGSTAQVFVLRQQLSVPLTCRVLYATGSSRVVSLGEEGERNVEELKYFEERR